MKRVIVTGANGFIGSSLVKKLVENNISVVALDISFRNRKLPESELVTEIEAGLDDVKALLSIIPKNEYDNIYHLAWAGVNGPDKANPLIQLENIKYSMNCAMLAKELGIKKILCAGTIAERATESLNSLEVTNGGMLYGVAKHSAQLMLEAYCKNIGLEYVWMQFSNIYGPTNKTGNLVSYTVGELKKGAEATFGPALQPYDFIYVEDLIEAVYRLGNSDKAGGLYFIGSGKPRILKEYLQEIGDAFEKPELIKTGVRPDDGITYSFEMFDIKKLENEIGNYISMDFSDGIRYTIDNY